MQPTHIQQSELNAANLAAHARSAAAQAASGPATPRAARGNIPAASAGAEQTDPFASIEQASDPGDNLTEISDDTELQQRDHQREHSDLVSLKQELKQEKERAAKLAAERDQEHKLRQAAEQGKAVEVATRLEAQRVADAKALQLQQERDAARAERDARPTLTQLQAITAERDGRPTTTQLQAMTAALNARPTLDSLTKVTRDLAAKVTELNVQRARMEAAELRAKQIVAALTPELQTIADKPEVLRKSIEVTDLALDFIFRSTALCDQFKVFRGVAQDPATLERRKAFRKGLGII